MNCKNCKKQGCSLAGKNHEMSFECKAYIGKTNADRIRAMSDEELAELMEDKGDCPPIECPHDGKGAKITRLDCKMCWLDWLKSPVEVDNGA